MNHIELFEMLAARPDGAPAEKGLLVLSTPRSGSTMFCDVLTNSGHIGICEEWFNERHFAAWQEVLGYDAFDMEEYLKWVTRKSTGSTGVIALHVHIGQLLNVTKTYEFSLGTMSFDHVVWIYREDKIAQAVSLAKAASTDQWKSTQRGHPEGKPDLSFRHISERLHTIIDQDQFYRKSLSHITDADYAYEQFLNMPCGNNSPWNRVMAALGKPNIGIPQTMTKIQRNADTKQVARDFRNYLSGV
jgi:LPS sulfotransferase NodH